MDHNKKLEFVHKMAKLGLQHFDGGGVISAGNTGAGLLGGIAGGLTTQNGFSADAPTSSQAVGGQQAALAGQLQTEAAGGGPNPAQQQEMINAQKIAQTNATTYAQNRALNPGLAARMAGNNAASMGQDVSADAAKQQAEQQIAAQQQLQGLTGQEQAGALGAAQINAGVAQNNANAVNDTNKGILGGISGVLGGLLAEGGEVESPWPMMADGGFMVPGAATYSMPTMGVADNSNAVAQASQDQSQGAAAGKKAASSVGQWIQARRIAGSTAGGPALAGGVSDAGGISAIAPALMMAANGGLMKKGGAVKAANPAQKAKIPGDSYENDKVPAMLSEGEVVIDRDTMKDPGAVGQMARALARHIQAKKGKKAA